MRLRTNGNSTCRFSCAAGRSASDAYSGFGGDYFYERAGGESEEYWVQLFGVESAVGVFVWDGGEWIYD